MLIMVSVFVMSAVQVLTSITMLKFGTNYQYAWIIGNNWVWFDKGSDKNTTMTWVLRTGIHEPINSFLWKLFSVVYCL